MPVVYVLHLRLRLIALVAPRRGLLLRGRGGCRGLFLRRSFRGLFRLRGWRFPHGFFLLCSRLRRGGRNMLRLGRRLCGGRFGRGRFRGFVAAHMVGEVPLGFEEFLEPLRALSLHALPLLVSFLFYEHGFEVPHLGEGVPHARMGLLDLFKQLLRLRFQRLCRIHYLRFCHHSTPLSFS